MMRSVSGGAVRRPAHASASAFLKGSAGAAFLGQTAGFIAGTTSELNLERYAQLLSGERVSVSGVGQSDALVAAMRFLRVCDKDVPPVQWTEDGFLPQVIAILQLGVGGVRVTSIRRSTPVQGVWVIELASFLGSSTWSVVATVDTATVDTTTVDTAYSGDADAAQLLACIKRAGAADLSLSSDGDDSTPFVVVFSMSADACDGIITFPLKPLSKQRKRKGVLRKGALSEPKKTQPKKTTQKGAEDAIVDSEAVKAVKAVLARARLANTPYWNREGSDVGFGRTGLPALAIYWKDGTPRLDGQWLPAASGHDAKLVYTMSYCNTKGTGHKPTATWCIQQWCSPQPLLAGKYRRNLLQPPLLSGRSTATSQLMTFNVQQGDVVTTCGPQGYALPAHIIAAGQFMQAGHWGRMVKETLSDVLTALGAHPDTASFLAKVLRSSQVALALVLVVDPTEQQLGGVADTATLASTWAAKDAPAQAAALAQAQELLAQEDPAMVYKQHRLQLAILAALLYGALTQRSGGSHLVIERLRDEGVPGLKDLLAAFSQGKRLPTGSSAPAAYQWLVDPKDAEDLRRRIDTWMQCYFLTDDVAQLKHGQLVKANSTSDGWDLLPAPYLATLADDRDPTKSELLKALGKAPVQIGGPPPKEGVKFDAGVAAAAGQCNFQSTGEPIAVKRVVQGALNAAGATNVVTRSMYDHECEGRNDSYPRNYAHVVSGGPDGLPIFRNLPFQKCHSYPNGLSVQFPCKIAVCVHTSTLACGEKLFLRKDPYNSVWGPDDGVEQIGEPGEPGSMIRICLPEHCPKTFQVCVQTKDGRTAVVCGGAVERTTVEMSAGSKGQLARRAADQELMALGEMRGGMKDVPEMVLDLKYGVSGIAYLMMDAVTNTVLAAIMRATDCDRRRSLSETDNDHEHLAAMVGLFTAMVRYVVWDSNMNVNATDTNFRAALEAHLLLTAPAGVKLLKALLEGCSQATSAWNEALKVVRAGCHYQLRDMARAEESTFEPGLEHAKERLIQRIGYMLEEARRRKVRSKPGKGKKRRHENDDEDDEEDDEGDEGDDSDEDDEDDDSDDEAEAMTKKPKRGPAAAKNKQKQKAKKRKTTQDVGLDQLKAMFAAASSS